MCTFLMIIFLFPLVCVHAFRRCNATFAEGETLFSVAPKYKIDWMLLWSLNGGDSPNTILPGATYRFAHQYIIQEGDTLASIAHNLATTPEAIMKLNFNRITHFATERQLLPGTVICVLPSFIDVRCLFSPSQSCSISLLPCLSFFFFLPCWVMCSICLVLWNRHMSSAFRVTEKGWGDPV